MSLLELRGLKVAFPTRRGTVEAAKGIDLDVEPGQVMGLVGESGAGKSTIGNAIVDLLEPPGRVTAGEVRFKGADLRQKTPEQMRLIRGREIGMIFQDPQTSLNPLQRIGDQLTESIRLGRGVAEAEAQRIAIDLLEAVGIPEPQTRLRSYPHEFSGGMRQRVVIALALSGDPDLVIADEPTTALDVSIQKQILDLIRQLCRDRQLGVILVTHDIGVIAEIADRVTVMYRGRVVETGPTSQVLLAPHHDYTRSLIAAVPPGDRRLHRFESVDYIEGGGARRDIDLSTHWLGKAREEIQDRVAVAVSGLSVSFVLKRSLLKRNRKMLTAVDQATFGIAEGETFGLVGESGSGKSTVAKLVAGLLEPDAGRLSILGEEIRPGMPLHQTRAIRRPLQMIFQDPYSSLNGRMRVLDVVAEPIRFLGLTDDEAETRQVVYDLLDHVGLGAEAARRHPHEFSGGQRQRISIARALAARPRILICDEPTSALDVSIQAQILNLLKDLQEELNLTMLFISHDLPVIRQMCDRVAVMRHGKILEIQETEALFTAPKDPYTAELLSLMPGKNMMAAAE